MLEHRAGISGPASTLKDVVVGSSMARSRDATELLAEGVCLFVSLDCFNLDYYSEQSLGCTMIASRMLALAEKGEAEWPHPFLE